MPTYPYQCPSCSEQFDVTKTISSLNDEEICKICLIPANRTIGKVNFVGGGDYTTSFNPAFGCLVKSKNHQREILKRFADQGKEFEEVGNEPVEKIHKYFDDKREAKRQEVWNEHPEKVMAEALN